MGCIYWSRMHCGKHICCKPCFQVEFTNRIHFSFKQVGLRFVNECKSKEYSQMFEIFNQWSSLHVKLKRSEVIYKNLYEKHHCSWILFPSLHFSLIYPSFISVRNRLPWFTYFVCVQHIFSDANLSWAVIAWNWVLFCTRLQNCKLVCEILAPLKLMLVAIDSNGAKIYLRIWVSKF